MTNKECRLYGIDLDGICFNFLKGFTQWLSDEANVRVPEDEEITSYYWYETVDGLDKDTFWSEFHKFGKAGGYKNLDTIPGAMEGLAKIAGEGHKLMYITNRPDYVLDDTKETLLGHDVPFADQLVFANGAKAPVIREYGVDVFIDDSPRTIAEICANTDARIYCMDYPMNRAIHDIHNYTRVKSWEEFLKAEGF